MISKFKVGDRVHHRSMEEYGTVTAIHNGVLHITYDRVTPAQPSVKNRKARPAMQWTGAYDDRWFVLHPDMLVRTDRAA